MCNSEAGENYRTPVPPAESRRHDVSSLARVEVRGTEGNEGNEVKTAFIERVVEKAREDWPVDGSVQEKWSVVRSALTETAVDILGKVKRVPARLVSGVHGGVETPPTAEE